MILQSNSTERNLQPARQNHKSKNKALGLRCYGFLTDSGEFDCALFGSRDFVYILGSRYIENDKGRFINAKLDADWLSNVTIINSRLGMVERNISHFLFIGLDLDGDKLDIPLTDDMIRQRCFMLGLPLPLIIETSPNRFHIIFIFEFPVPVTRKAWYKATQSALHRAFEDLGSDKRLFKDLVYFQRNWNQADSINKRHSGKPKTHIREKGELCSLSQLSDALNRHGYMEGNEHIPVKIRLEAFLRENPEHKGKQKALAEKLSSSIRRLKDAIKELRKEGKLLTEIVGKYANRMTQFFYKSQAVMTKSIKCNRSIKDLVQTTPSQTGKALGTSVYRLIGEAWSRAQAGGLPYGVRNSGLWLFALWLKLSRGLSHDGVMLELQEVYLLSRSQGKWFSVCEFHGVVASACKERYQRLIGRKALEKAFDLVFYALGFTTAEIYGGKENAFH